MLFPDARSFAIVGRIQTRSYDDRDGKKVYVTEVIANQIQLLDSRSRSDFGGAPDPYLRGGGTSLTRDEISRSIEAGEGLDDDLPF